MPLGFVRPWWKVRLHGAVPLGSAKHAGVNAARICGKSVPQECPRERESVPREYLDTLTSADVPPHICAPISPLHIHTVTPAHSPSPSLFLHTVEAARSTSPPHHTHTSLHIYITSVHPHCRSFTSVLSFVLSAYLFSRLCAFTSSHAHIHRSTSPPPYIYTSISHLHIHTVTPSRPPSLSLFLYIFSTVLDNHMSRSRANRRLVF